MTYPRRRLAQAAGLALAVLVLGGCTNDDRSSGFHSPDGSLADAPPADDGALTDSANRSEAGESYDEPICDNPPGPVYCSVALGPVASLDAADAGVVVQCPPEFPSCEPPGFGPFPGWQCCFNCENPPLAECTPPPNGGADSGGADAPGE